MIFCLLTIQTRVMLTSKSLIILIHLLFNFSTIFVVKIEEEISHFWLWMIINAYFSLSRPVWMLNINVHVYDDEDERFITFFIITSCTLTTTHLGRINKYVEFLLPGKKKICEESAKNKVKQLFSALENIINHIVILFHHHRCTYTNLTLI